MEHYPLATGGYCANLHVTPAVAHTHDHVCHEVHRLFGDMGRDSIRACCFAAVALGLSNAVQVRKPRDVEVR